MKLILENAVHVSKPAEEVEREVATGSQVDFTEMDTDEDSARAGGGVDFTEDSTEVEKAGKKKAQADDEPQYPIPVE